MTIVCKQFSKLKLMSLLLLLVRVQFIDLKISGVRGKRESGQGWTGPVGPQRECALSQV